MMVLVSLLTGIGIGLLEKHLNSAVVLGHELPTLMVILLGLVFGGSVLIVLAQWWIASPYDRLVRQIDRVAQRRNVNDLTNLPLTRRDEAGRIARAMHCVTTVAIRDGHEARQLRKTIDRRVRDATRQATAELERMALRDPLTDLGNRRLLDQHLPRIVSATRESGTELIALAIDMDGFKQVNDRLGHDAGDELLVLLAGLLKACTRRDDLSMRIGGDEFVVLMPGCDIGRAKTIADSIRTLLRQQTAAMLAGKATCDLSVGVACLRADGCDNGPALLKRADQRLYKAKRAGKGRTCTSDH